MCLRVRVVFEFVSMCNDASLRMCLPCRSFHFFPPRSNWPVRWLWTSSLRSLGSPSSACTSPTLGEVKRPAWSQTWSANRSGWIWGEWSQACTHGLVHTACVLFQGSSSIIAAACVCLAVSETLFVDLFSLYLFVCLLVWSRLLFPLCSRVYLPISFLKKIFYNLFISHLSVVPWLMKSIQSLASVFSYHQR